VKCFVIVSIGMIYGCHCRCKPEESPLNMKTPVSGPLKPHDLMLLLVRLAALAEALALPAVLACWVWMWHPSTPGIRLLLGCVVAYWAAKRVYAATMDLGSVTWRWTRLAAAVLAVWVLEHAAV
jgi:hypothetical protein